MNNFNSAKSYGWDSVEIPCSCAVLSPTVIRLVKRLNGKRIIDLGCGNGVLCSLLQKEGVVDIAGVEQDRIGVAKARKLCPEANIYQYSFADNPNLVMEAEGQGFDLAISTEVIEHLFAPTDLLAYAHALLNENGKFIISTPYHGYMKNLAIALFAKWDHHHSSNWEGGHVKFWSRNAITELIQANGFKVIDFIGVGRAPYLWKSMILLCEKQAIG